jgi:DNA-binding PadR family transcriptional regulator
MIEELRHHGYVISPGTLYPMLHALESAGALRSSQTVVAGKTRRYYRTTKAGDAMLKELRLRTRELVGEVLGTPPARVMKRPLKRVA